jgi:hypothetical protein
MTAASPSTEWPGVYLLECTKGFRGLKSNAEKALEQLADADLHYVPDKESNSIVILMKHLAGNMLSRFTDFLTSDGEKPDRNRDGEFIDDITSRSQLMDYWNKGWNCLFDALSQLGPDDLLRTVTIRGEPHTVLRALQRQLVHYAYHCGQIVYIAKMIRSEDFHSLSIPRGESGKYISRPPGNG